LNASELLACIKLNIKEIVRTGSHWSREKVENWTFWSCSWIFSFRFL